MGFFPAEDPQLAILVILDEPQRDKWGGVAAAPVFHAIGEQLLTCFRTNLRANPTLEEGKPGIDMKLQLASTPVILPPAQSESEAEATLIPDFRGMTIREVLKKSKKRGLRYRSSAAAGRLCSGRRPACALLKTASVPSSSAWGHEGFRCDCRS